MMVCVKFYCYVIDVNWDLVGVSFYLGQNMMGLIFEIDFDGILIWKDGQVLIDVDVVSCLCDFYVFYYGVFVGEIECVKVIYGIVVFYDCYFICLYIFFLFDGKLLDFNIGMDSGKICVLVIEVIVVLVIVVVEGYMSILNGCFKGGWMMCYYGRLEIGVYVIQMEFV